MKKILLLILTISSLFFISCTDSSTEIIETNNQQLPFDPMAPETKDGSIIIGG
ncbi:hypothetical protein [Tenacibaculum jejuense]|uniref:Lipoprotein n=1 Tax=Tenacibaculum jejuense TaxID=584609 RepID=A0A238U8V7_9FLAO|nr:hypothetical protein [Tenacibaculum jejuense]SNR15633.1 Hypothetical protein TJEJU_1929 [Tenacibaculum jejuense]